jgi:hypothetical protein
MKVKQADFVEYLADDGCWEMAICMKEWQNSFDIMCLDGMSRKFTDADENIKWRFPE